MTPYWFGFESEEKSFKRVPVESSKNNLLFSHVKISCLRAKAYLHWYFTGVYIMNYFIPQTLVENPPLNNPEIVSNEGCASGIAATENRIDPDSAYNTLPTGLFQEMKLFDVRSQIIHRSSFIFSYCYFEIHNQKDSNIVQGPHFFPYKQFLWFTCLDVVSLF